MVEKNPVFFKKINDEIPHENVKNEHDKMLASLVL